MIAYADDVAYFEILILSEKVSIFAFNSNLFVIYFLLNYFIRT